MARSRTSKFDASETITNELIRIIERGVLPWRKPWTAGDTARPLRHNSEPYQGVNNFLLTMRTVMAGYTSPFWMTVPQANTLGAKIRKGERPSVVVYYGQSRAQTDDEQDANDGNADEARVFRFQKSYRVFNADQIEGLPDAFHPDACSAPDHTPSAPIPHMQSFFDAIDITTVLGGTEARYNPPVDKVFMPSIERFKIPLNFYGVWAHELAHATKAPHRLNRDYGLSRFGNTAYSREEIVAELTSCFLGQELGFTAHTARAERFVFVSLATCAALGQIGDFQARGRCPEGLRLSDREVGGGQGRGRRSGRLRGLVLSQAMVLKE
jgi:antirestriction protein ArdC